MDNTKIKCENTTKRRTKPVSERTTYQKSLKDTENEKAGNLVPTKTS